MRQVVMHAPGDVRVEDREDPTLIEPTDAIIRLSATCICGSDLWPYRGAEHVEHQVMGHEYVGVVEEVGAEVRAVKVGDFVVGSFWASDIVEERGEDGVAKLKELTDKVFDLTLPLEQAAEGYRAMDRRTATKVLLLP